MLTWEGVGCFSLSNSYTLIPLIVSFGDNIPEDGSPVRHFMAFEFFPVSVNLLNCFTSSVLPIFCRCFTLSNSYIFFPLIVSFDDNIPDDGSPVRQFMAFEFFPVSMNLMNCFNSSVLPIFCRCFTLRNSYTFFPLIVSFGDNIPDDGSPVRQFMAFEFFSVSVNLLNCFNSSVLPIFCRCFTLRNSYTFFPLIVSFGDNIPDDGSPVRQFMAFEFFPVSMNLMNCFTLAFLSILEVFRSLYCRTLNSSRSSSRRPWQHNFRRRARAFETDPLVADFTQKRTR